MALHDVQAACDVLRPVYDATGGVDGYVSWEVAPRLAHDTEGTLEQGRMYWDLVDRPNLMIKIPATDAGAAGDRGGALRRPEHQRHAAVQRRGLRARDGGLLPRDGAPPGGGQAAGPPLGRLVLRLARGHRGRQAPGGARQHRAAGHGRPGQRPRRLPGLPEGLRGRALRDAARGRLPGPAPAVGLDRRQEPGLPADALRLGPGRPEHRQHDADAGAAGRRRRRRRDRRDRRRRPDRRPEGARRRRASTSTT